MQVSTHADAQQLMREQHKQEFEKVKEDSQTAVSGHQATINQLEEQLAQRYCTELDGLSPYSYIAYACMDSAHNL